MASSRSAVAKALFAIVVVFTAIEELFGNVEFLSMRNHFSKYFDAVNGVTPLSHVHVRLSVIGRGHKLQAWGTRCG